MLISSYLVSLAVALGTYQLGKNPKISPTRSSALVSLLFFLLIYLADSQTSVKLSSLYGLAFGASFIGMSSYKVMSIKAIAIASFVFTSIYIFLEPSSWQLGGALGFSAFLSVFFSRILPLNKISS